MIFELPLAGRPRAPSIWAWQGLGDAAVIFGDFLAAGMLCVTVSHRRSYSNTWPLPDAAAATTGMDHSDAEKLEKLDKKDSRVH